MIGVVIPSKTFSNVIPCLRAVRKHEPHDNRLVVVDDGLNTEEQIAVHYEQAAITAGQKPFIFARNVNRGIGVAGNDCEGYVVLNDDALLESPNGFSLLAQSAREHPEFGIIGATTNVTGQPLQWRKNTGLREVPHFAFICVYIPRTTIDRVGLLDERYCIDYGVEDRDYCEAVRRAGLKCGVHDGCYVDHGSLRSTFRGDPRTPRSFAKNYELFKAKWGVA